MTNQTQDERLKRLRLLARSSVVGADIKWLLDVHDDFVSALETILAYNGAAPDAVQKMKVQAAAVLERMGVKS